MGLFLVINNKRIILASFSKVASHFIFISSESVAEKTGMYGFTKVLNEQIAQRFFEQKQLNVLTLPRAFIPHWNHEVYKYSREGRYVRVGRRYSF